MGPSRRKGASKAAAAAAARRQWKVGDLVLAKVKGFPAWPATVSEPEKWGYSADWKKVLVYFFGTQQIAFCNPADVEPFTEEKKQSILTKRHGKGSDFVRAVQEIIESYDNLKKQNQSDDFNSEEVDMKDRNMASSSADVGLKQKGETPEATRDSQLIDDDQSGPSFPVEDTSAFIDDVDNKEAADTTVVKETPLHTVYSSRKRTRDLPLQNGKSKQPLVRRSRSSSRLEHRRLRDSVMQCSSDPVKSSGTVPSASIVCEGFLTRNQSKRKSAETSEFDDADLSTFASSGSIEDNGSDVITVESDTPSLNEGSAIDSDCKLDNSEAIIGCFPGDLQIKAIVLKKKRKPSRKRPPNDLVEPMAKLDKEAGVQNTSENSQNGFDSYMSGSCPKEDGDKHLPLVKRARVRMGEPSSLKEPDRIKNSEENAQTELMIHTSGEMNKSSNFDDHNDRQSFMINGASPSQGCGQFHGNKPNHWKARKDQSFGCSVDGEAALPPSKRLHRALEAMSANAAEEGQSHNDESSTVNTHGNGCLIASISGSHMAVEQTAAVQNVDAIGSEAQGAEVPGCPTSFSPVAGENTESTPETDFNDQRAESSNSQNNESGKDTLLDAERCADEKSPCGGSDGGEVIPTALVILTPRHALSSPDTKSDVRSVQGSEDELLLSKDEGNTDKNEPINCRSEKTANEFGMCEGTALSGDPISDTHEDRMEASRESGVGAFQSNTDGDCFEKSRSSELPLDDSREEHDMSEVVTEVVVNKQMQKEPSSVSFPNGHVGDGVGIHSSPSVTDGGNSLAQASPHNASSGHVSTSDNSSFIQNNGSCSPDVHLHHKITLHTLLDEEGKSESLVSGRPKYVVKYAELTAALSSFEAMLGSLTRTKESIGRATRVAIDCAKLGVSSKVVDILAHSLEIESSLHRRVDLFFLVDSILKGDIGGSYPSAIQAMLPRLLAAAAPPGNSAHENRRQCHKVLRLWLERKMLSESVIRRHMRELESHAYSRRSLRTQRSFDDPLREMEGMLVDEYGSNSSFQLPGFCMPSMVKEEGGGSDSDGESFEAVAAEHSPENREDHETSAIEKHRHILEDVDGELEMEDVAPSCEIELNSSSGAIGADSAQMSQNQFEQQYSVPFAPPLPQDVPPSSPPLPSSPPPSLAPLPPLPPPGAVSDPCANGIDSKHYADSHENVTQSSAQQLNTPRNNRTMSEAVHYPPPDCRDVQRQLPESYHGSYFHNKGYPTWPPHPPPTNQFPYGRGEPHFKPRREVGPPPPYSNRHHFEQHWDRENYYNNHERMEQGPHEPHDSWRFQPHSFSGPRYPGKGKYYGPDPFVGPPYEERFPNQGWRFRPRSMNHRNSMPFRPPLDGPIPVSNRGPGYWRPR